MKYARLLAFALVALLPARSARSQDWPHLRGGELSGRADGGGLFERERRGPGVAWRAPLGPAYSGVAVAAGHAVTLASNGAVDDLVAFHAATGAELWRLTLGPHHRGHDGSEDGPISSPAIGQGKVFALDAHGRFVAADLADGTEVWSKDLVREYGAPAPEYGFTTSPLVEGDLVVLQVGGPDERSLCAFETGTGRLAWSRGVAPVGYQSPIAMDLGGRRQLVVLNGASILGIAPADGDVLWTHAFADERDSAESGFALPIDGTRFVATVSGATAMFSVEPTAEGWAARELYRSRELGSSYAAPVYYDGHLYGFQSAFLTCVDAATGRRVWKSRPPGGRGLILVDDRLVVFGAQGTVAVVRATPTAYEEEAAFPALAHTSYTWPSFADGRVFVRNSDELCCIDFGRGEEPEPASASSEPTGHAFGRFVAAVEAAEDKEARIDAFLAEQDEFPILSGDLVHIVFQGEVEDLAVAGTMIDGSRPDPMHRIAGTNFYHGTYALEPGARLEYRFHVDFSEWRSDPLNPRTAPALWGEPMSEIVSPTYERATHYAEPEGRPRGRVETFEFVSGALGNSRGISVWLPPGYDESDARYPLLIVHEGAGWLDEGRMANSLDNLVGDRVRPLVVAFVEALPQWWFEAGGSGTEAYVAMLADEFVPSLSERYRISERAADHALMGTEGFGLTAAYGVLLENDAFGKAAVQSVALGDVARHAFFELLEAGPRRDASFYVDWNRYEDRNRDRGYDHREDSRRLVQALRAAGYDVAGGEALDSYGWEGWRSRTDDLLAALFPLD